MSTNPAKGRLMNKFAAYAIGAVKAEREFRYSDAAKLWFSAMWCPCNAKNRMWAEIRNEFCAAAAKRLQGRTNARKGI
ncbi:ANR family transcriptional regulator [Erwinia psidii]|uniref:ANR family transcriptional regulator n=1 Tax=Erwinia psidii TaxID=69224 RepID=UPI00226B60AE|nr:ANR family transcriptional regulator [Erwinia psidii]MCX8957196.1 ANR family transcriptional regulator [Erwinia psidii]